MMPNFEISGSVAVAEIWRFNGFQNGGYPPYWIFKNLKFYLPVWFRVKMHN